MIEEGTSTLGRGPSNKLVIPSEVISNKHCEFVWKEGTCYVRDIGSSLGTFYRIAKEKLKVGDIYELGSVELVVKKIHIASKPADNQEISQKGPISVDDLLSSTDNSEPYNFVEVDLLKDDHLFRNCMIVESGSIGRKGASSICIPLDDHMSGKHCQIFFENGHFWIEDAPSMNG